MLRQTHYQASSIHSRRRVSSIIHSHDRTPNESPPPPPLPVLPVEPASKRNIRMTRENRLLSDLWLMSAATFRRLGKIEQAKGAIQEAEVRDECNPGVWVQVCCSALFLELECTDACCSLACIIRHLDKTNRQSTLSRRRFSFSLTILPHLFTSLGHIYPQKVLPDLTVELKPVKIT